MSLQHTVILSVRWLLIEKVFEGYFEEKKLCRTWTIQTHWRSAVVERNLLTRLAEMYGAIYDSFDQLVPCYC